MGKAIVSLMNAHVASIPTFFPAADGNRQHDQLVVNFMINGRKNPKTGKQPVVAIAGKFWGKYAGVAAFQLKKGSAVNIVGALSTFQRDTGKVENGKKVIEEKVSIVVDSFEHAGQTTNELIALINKNMAAWNSEKAAGRIDPNAVITAEILLKKPEPTVVPDYNPMIAEQTGMFGNARVFVKGRGFIGAGAKPGQTAQAASTVTPEALAAAIQQILAAGKGVDPAALKAAEVIPAVETAPADVIDPLAAAQVG